MREGPSRPARPRAAVLVEGASDRCALEALARRQGRDLVAEGVSVLPMGGATNVGRFLERLGPHGLDLRLTGLCDAAEVRHFARAVERSGLAGQGADLEALGFFTCVRDLEDELIRALGTDRVEHVIARQGELVSLRRLQKQPAQRERSVEDQLRRFLGCRSGRKARYATLLVEALAEAEVPRPLAGVLARA